MMTRFLLSLALLCPFVAKAAVPSFQDFYGTNGIIIRTNGVLGNQKVTVDGTNLVPFSKVWGTNGIIVRTNNGIVAIDGNSLVTKTNAMTWGLTNTGTFTNSGDAFFGQSMDIFDALNVRGTLNVWDSATFSNGIRIPGYNATSNYVWTATNANGMGEWRVAQGGTNTASSGTNVLVFAFLNSDDANGISFGKGTKTNLFLPANTVSTNVVIDGGIIGGAWDTNVTIQVAGWYFINADLNWVRPTIQVAGDVPPQQMYLKLRTNAVVDNKFTVAQTLVDTNGSAYGNGSPTNFMSFSGIAYLASNTIVDTILDSDDAYTITRHGLTLFKIADSAVGGTGTGALTVQTNGVTVGTESTVNWTIGVTGYVSGGVLNLGLSGSGAGEANYNGEFSLTNANQYGWVYGKSGVTNLLRSFRPGYGLLGTNESTNIVVAIDPSVISTNSFHPDQFVTNAGVVSFREGAKGTNFDFYNITNRGALTNQGAFGVLGLSTFVGGVEIPGHGATSNWVWTATNATTGRGEWRQAQGGVDTIANFVIVDPIYGNDATGRTNRFDLAFGTIGRAVQESTNFSKGAILLYAGTHDMGDFAAELPRNVSLIGLAGSGSTLIRSSRTITGLTSNSCVIAPSDNSRVQGVTIECTARYLSFTAGIGSISNSFVQQRSGTNVVVNDVVILSGTDGFYWDHGGIHDWKIYDSRALTSWDSFAVQTSVNTNSVFEVYNTKLEVLFGVGYTNSNGDGRAVIITRGTGKFYGCDFISVGNTNAYAFYSGRSSGVDASVSSWAELYACRFFSKTATVGGLIEYNLLTQPTHPAYVYGWNNALPKNTGGAINYPDLEVPINKFATNLTLRNPLIPNHNISSNYVWTATNTTTGGGEWRAIPSLTNAPAGNFAIVDPILGDDSTARTNTLLLPFKSLGAAIDQATNFAVGVILLRPGLHDLTNRAAVLPNNVSLIGAGMYATTVRSTRTITGTASNSCVIKPGNNSVVSDLTIDCFARTNSSTAGIGSISNAFAAQTPFTNVLVKNVWSISGADGFYLDHPAYHSWKLENCRSTTSWDSYSHQSTVNTNTTVEAFNCTFESLYGTAFTNSTGDGRAVFFARGIGYWYGCRFIVKGFTNCYGFYSGSVSTTSATNELYACSILTETNTVATSPDDHDLFVAANHVMRVFGNNHTLKTTSAGSIRYNPPLAPGTAITFSTNANTGLLTINSTGAGGGTFNPSQFEVSIDGLLMETNIKSGAFFTNTSFLNLTNRGQQTNFGNLGVGGNINLNGDLEAVGNVSTLSLLTAYGKFAFATTNILYSSPTVIFDGAWNQATLEITNNITLLASNILAGFPYYLIITNAGNFTVTIPQGGAGQWESQIISQIPSNQASRLVIEKPAFPVNSVTNFSLEGGDFVLQFASPIIAITNLLSIPPTITISNTVSLVSNYQALAVGALTVSNQLRMLPATIEVTTTNTLLDLSTNQNFILLLMTNTTVVFTNQAAGIIPGSVLIQQDTNGQHTINLVRVAGGVLHTNGSWFLDTNANALGWFQFQSAVFGTNIVISPGNQINIRTNGTLVGSASDINFTAAGTVGSISGTTVTIAGPSVGTVSGAGSGSTNYLLNIAATTEFYLGSSNVHIYTVTGGTFGSPVYWNAFVTNLSADTWGINFASGTNRWKFSGVYGTNAPSVLTNNTLLQLCGRSDGTNTLVGYTYYRPGL